MLRTNGSNAAFSSAGIRKLHFAGESCCRAPRKTSSHALHHSTHAVDQLRTLRHQRITGRAPAPSRLVLRNCDAAPAIAGSHQLAPVEPACARPDDRSCDHSHKSAGPCGGSPRPHRVPVLAAADSPRENVLQLQSKFVGGNSLNRAANASGVVLTRSSSSAVPAWSNMQYCDQRSLRPIPITFPGWVGDEQTGVLANVCFTLPPSLISGISCQRIILAVCRGFGSYISIYSPSGE